MSFWQSALVGAAIVVALYALFIAGLLVAGRRRDVRAWAGFVPDCVVLVQRLLRDARVPRSSKLLLGALVVYLVVPFDLVPDFIPVAGQLDDAILVAFVLRRLLRSTDPSVIVASWPGPRASLDVVLRLAGRAPLTAV